MKSFPKKYKLFIVVNIIFLIVLTIIQLSWIVQSAKQQESIFSTQVNLALIKTIEELSENKQVCLQVQECIVHGNKCCGHFYNLGDDERQAIDSIIRLNLSYYNLDIDYEFQIYNKSDFPSNINQVLGNNNYSKSLEQTFNAAGIHLKLNFPDKSYFIISQIGGMFILSIVLIILISFSFILSVVNLNRMTTLAINTRNFVDNMVHELKTPITNIRFANNMMSKQLDGISNGNIIKYNKIINDENNKLKTQVENVLLISSSENYNNFAVCNESIIDIIKEVINDYDLIISELSGKISFKTNINNTFIACNKDYLKHAFANLIDNAIKYSLNSPEIAINVYSKNNIVYVEISDKGIGIKKEYLTYIFNKYYRVPTGDVHDVKGFGLGLAFVKNVIEAIKGQISVISELGKGTTFILTLPIVENND